MGVASHVAWGVACGGNGLRGLVPVAGDRSGLVHGVLPVDFCAPVQGAGAERGAAVSAAALGGEILPRVLTPGRSPGRAVAWGPPDRVRGRLPGQVPEGTLACCRNGLRGLVRVAGVWCGLVHGVLAALLRRRARMGHAGEWSRLTARRDLCLVLTLHGVPPGRARGHARGSSPRQALGSGARGQAAGAARTGAWGSGSAFATGRADGAGGGNAGATGGLRFVRRSHVAWGPPDRVRGRLSGQEPEGMLARHGPKGWSRDRASDGRRCAAPRA
jgi:hypothetical protein